MLITLGAFTVVGQAFMQTTVKKLAANNQQQKPKQVAEITRAEPAPRNDWDKNVEEQARRDAMSQREPERPIGSDSPAVKQTVFNEGGVLSLHESYQPVEPRKPFGKVTAIVVFAVL